jgi:hypothetical protein
MCAVLCAEASGEVQHRMVMAERVEGALAGSGLALVVIRLVVHHVALDPLAFALVAAGVHVRVRAAYVKRPWIAALLTAASPGSECPGSSRPEASSSFWRAHVDLHAKLRGLGKLRASRSSH